MVDFNSVEKTHNNNEKHEIKHEDQTKKFWPYGWWKLMDDYKIGVIPLPLFIIAGILIFAEVLVTGKLPSEIVVMVVTCAFFGFLCGEIGKRLPIVGKMGAAAICATFIPSALVYYGILPTPVVQATTKFYKDTHILYLYICCIIVGSIMNMDKKTLIQGFLKIFGPMVCGEIVGMLVGVGVGYLLGLSPFETFFFLVLPIMAGGVGEGAIPLSIGYASILGMEQGEALGRVLPIVMLGGLTGIICGGILNRIGKAYPHLTGNGRLLPASEDDQIINKTAKTESVIDVTTFASGVLLAAILYMVGMIGHKVTGIPAPVGMLFAAVFVKLVSGVSPKVLSGSQVVYKFFQTSVTYPILFAVGVAITPWDKIVAAFTVINLIVIVCTVVSLVTTGFFVAKKLGMYPVDAAVISCCQSGQGGTGDVAILTAAERMELMPFAQIATRIGGAINVSVSLLILGNFLV
ncbi:MULTISPECIES: 2-hydroxycarboxylate transporter family protein [Gilliamella]|uniref:Malate permease n=1 Tax=Gilliamella apis TaxID=1970738 RepID=A0A242NVR1_9GAMM|nr:MULTISPECIES: 2-hydroxycarboxylate transporter family protein [Gilliamella]MBI0006932.1 2-hydroxycarboxylate transporter family protein [Gilliamella sp. W8126]MBI0038421.1 2-hydroxycarboxylate transporter family protein [Gilliamella sp. B14384G10]MBI0040282.1 2-hydroxycarboxylate transporter family protein [Gilliamella sp. B14384G7]MBI0052121.1 2-hydroxycarboxylate transporter family protein [Gilliamella sp. B14384G13]MBI0054708.1 2-hydroxycarboxylate transporter family protein [Gilliamella